jgi:DNA polymerase
MARDLPAATRGQTRSGVCGNPEAGRRWASLEPDPDTPESLLAGRRTLAGVRRAASGCRGCPLWRDATRTVFGAGPPDAALMLVGEQPGDREDERGEPFVGPAGRILAEALEAARIDRADVYLTNAVKHFKFETRGKRRIHQRPSAAETAACRPWLEAELRFVKPHAVGVLGATAARSLLGSGFRVTRHRGELLEVEFAPVALATIHPSAVLRARTPAERREGFDALAADLSILARAL